MTHRAFRLVTSLLALLSFTAMLAAVFVPNLRPFPDGSNRAIGVPEHIHSDHGPEFVAKDLLSGWLTRVLRHSTSSRDHPWENGYFESLNSNLKTSSWMAKSST
jgi:transposase InsO family protein